MMHAVLSRNHDWSRVWRGSACGFCLFNAVHSQHFGRDFRLFESLIASTSWENIVHVWILILNNSQWLTLWSCGEDWLLLLVFSVWTLVIVSSVPLWSCCSLDDVLVQRRLSCPIGYAVMTYWWMMSKWVLILGGLYSGLLLYIYVILPALK